MGITNLIKLIQEAKSKGRIVFVCGNGGSASNAEHFTNDLFKNNVRAMCLNSNVSQMTMIANDYGYESIFSMPLAVFSSPGDLLITISCSGTSKNILKVQEAAKLFRVQIVNFPVFKTKKKYTFREYGLLEDKHLQIIHKVAAAI